MAAGLCVVVAVVLVLTLRTGRSEQETAFLDTSVSLTSSYLDMTWLGHLMWLADRAITEGRHAEVEVVCREALRLAPAFIGALDRLATHYKNNHELAMQAMVSLFKTQLDLNVDEAPGPHVLEGLEQRIMVQANEAYEDPATPDEVLKAMDRAGEFLRAGNLVECENHLRRLLAKVPTHPKLLRDLGSVYILREEWAMCVMLYGYAHQLYPSDSDFANNYGLALDRIGRTAGALRVLTRQLEVNPDTPFLLSNCGRLARKLGLLPQAVKLYANWVSVDPTNPDSWFQYGLALLEDKRTVFARVSFRKVLEIAPKHEGAMYFLAAMDAVEGKLPSAARQLIDLGMMVGKNRMGKILSEPPFDTHPTLRSVLDRLPDEETPP